MRREAARGGRGVPVSAARWRSRARQSARPSAPSAAASLRRRRRPASVTPAASLLPRRQEAGSAQTRSACGFSGWAEAQGRDREVGGVGERGGAPPGRAEGAAVPGAREVCLRSGSRAGPAGPVSARGVSPARTLRRVRQLLPGLGSLPSFFLFLLHLRTYIYLRKKKYKKENLMLSSLMLSQFVPKLGSFPV